MQNNVAFLLQSELLPVHAKSLGNSLMGIIEYFSLFLSVKTVPALVEHLGLHGNFLLNCLVNLATLMLSYFVMPETSGLTLEEIEDIYRPKSCMKNIVDFNLKVYTIGQKECQRKFSVY